MELLLVALGILVLSGLLALATARWPRCCTALGVAGAVLGGGVGLVPAIAALAGGPPPSLRLPWQVPFGSFFVELDALSAFFVVPILALSALAAVHGSSALLAFREQKNLGLTWFFYNLMAASLVLVAIARNGVLFLVAWEVMSLTSFFLVTFHDEKESVRSAGWLYLISTHLGTAALLALFLLLGRGADPLDFDAFVGGSRSAGAANLLFLLALIGFGTKAGLMPFHVWLPETYPAAPSHVSAVMSGVLSKTGIYGLLRVLTFLGPPPAWWAWLLIGLGLVSGIGGVLFALAQQDLKRLLAYSSVENVGIIVLGLGIGLLGLSAGSPALAVLGFAGGLLHVINHTLFKGLLFLGAGGILQATGTGAIDELGGLAKRLPGVASAFLIGAAAISGLPPFNGFVSEFLIYLGAFREGIELRPAALPPLLVIAGLALIGGLATACFAKAYGIVFLGQPRSKHAAQAHPPGKLLTLPMFALAAGCLLLSGCSPWLVPALAPVVGVATGLPLAEAVSPALQTAAGSLGMVVATAAVLLALVLGLTFLRRWLLQGRAVSEADTWGCGYTRPTARMQYSGSSFAQPLTNLFQAVLRTRQTQPVLAEYFPAEETLTTSTPDVCQESLLRPLFRSIGWLLARLHWLQQGYLQVYLLYIFGTLVLLLLWQFTD